MAAGESYRVISETTWQLGILTVIVVLFSLGLLSSAVFETMRTVYFQQAQAQHIAFGNFGESNSPGTALVIFHPTPHVGTHSHTHA